LIALAAFVPAGCSNQEKAKQMEIQKQEENAKINIGQQENMQPYITDLEQKETEEKLRDPAVIGSATTPLLNKTESRIKNIERACDELDKLKIKPGDGFSFNGQLGKRTEAKGYKKAPIIITTEDGPEKGYGVGGGICQLSSTLYNAVKDAGLKVTERHSHSKDVGYVPRGSDATVVYGRKDLKFVNTRQNTIEIRTYLDESSLTVEIRETDE
jgi:vancomycin resistance protein YoaR